MILRKIIKKIKGIQKRKKFKSYFNDYISYDITHLINELPFELFKDFYENGDLDIVNWKSDKLHIFIKSEMDLIYNYITKFRSKWLQKQFNFLDRISIKENKNFELEINDTLNDSNNRKLFEMSNRIESFVDKCDSKYLKKIIDIRHFLWT